MNVVYFLKCKFTKRQIWNKS